MLKSKDTSRIETEDETANAAVSESQTKNDVSYGEVDGCPRSSSNLCINDNKTSFKKQHATTKIKRICLSEPCRAFVVLDRTTGASFSRFQQSTYPFSQSTTSVQKFLAVVGSDICASTIQQSN